MGGIIENATIKLPAKNDREGFNRLFKCYFPRLIAYAELFLDTENARDIVQDLMVHLWDQSENISIHSSLDAYLFRSVYRRCLNRINHDNVVKEYCLRSAVMFKEEERFYDPENNPVILKIFSNELHREIKDAIDCLPEKCRQAFISRYIDGLKTKEIAGMLQITERTAETHIYHALKHLRAKLKDKFYVLLFL